jgi:hypothetical protein
MFYNNVSKDKAKRVSIEIHHIPFTMYDIVATVLRKYEEEEIPIDPYAIAEEVVALHYKGMVSLVPLSTTVHELYHRGDVFIPLQYVDKGFVLFYQAYKPDGTKDDNYPLQYPVDTGFWIVPSDDPEYKDYVFDVCGRKWPYKVIPRENKKEK